MRHGIGRRTLLTAAGATFSFPAIRAHAQAAGVALVIGNSKYQWEAPLPNVRRDAPDIARRFQAFGLKTDLVQDAGRDAIRKAIDNFSAAARGAHLAAFYFAGHGAAWGKTTYLVPADADLATPNTVDNLIPVPAVATGMDAASNRLLVFDNCRNNPADGWRQREAEAAATQGDRFVMTPNTLRLFSTTPGRIALDGPAGENSPFAAAFLRQFEGQSVDLQTLSGRLRRDLLIATEGRQVLYGSSNYASPFVLKGTPAKAPANKSAWASDPSKIVEIPNAYAFAQQNDLLLPEGLIAHRPPSSSRHGTKVGAFKFDSHSPESGFTPTLVVVISVEEQEGGEIIIARRVRGQGTLRFIRAKLSGDTLDHPAVAGLQQYVFKWNDANSGSVTTFFSPRQGGGATNMYNGRFTRLDG